MTRATLRFSSLACAVAAAVSCNTLFGVEEKTYDQRKDAGSHDAGTDVSAATDATDADSGESEADSDGSEDADAAECGAGFLCAPPVPSGWTGPVVLSTGTPPADCGDDWPDAIGPYGTGGVVASPVTCSSCGCSAPDGGTCTGELDLFSGSGCTGTPATPIGAGPSCKSTTFTATSGKLQKILVGVHGTCPSTGGQVTNQPDPIWAGQALLCGLGADAGTSACAAGVCVPKPSGSPRPCIYTTGDTECLAPGYTQKQLVYQSVADTRGCTFCQCAPATGEDCTQFMATAYTQSLACGAGQAYGFYYPGACSDAFGSAKTVESVSFKNAATGGMCQPVAQTAPKGDVQPADPLTLCCMP